MATSRQLRLRPGLTCTWLDERSVQIGVSRRTGTVLTGLSALDVAAIRTLQTGARGPHSRRPGARLIALLDEAGLLSRASAEHPVPSRQRPDATVTSLVRATRDDGGRLMAHRAGRTVAVVGAGRLGSTLAAGLAAAGVGEIAVYDLHPVGGDDLTPGGATPGWEGRPRADAAADRVREAGARARSGARLRVDPLAPPDVVVLVDQVAADAAAADLLMSIDVAHLSVVVREAEIVVGPLVTPGDGPCLRCLDLHRSDRDPGWRQVLAQHPAASARRAEETGSTLVAAGLATLQVLAHLDAAVLAAPERPRPELPGPGTTLEVELPLGLPAARVWPVHPRCGCQRLPEPAGAGGRSAQSPARPLPRAKAGAGGTGG